MKVRCIYNIKNKQMVEEKSLKNVEATDHRYDFTIGKEYTVIGIAYSKDSTYLENYPMLELVNDFGNYEGAPLFLFEIIDDRSSQYWHIKFNNETKYLYMWPESFYQEYYFDDLTDGVPEVEKDFERVSKLLEEEIY